ncbi:GGDEF domain-containing protein [Ningiella sp. W23]|uniref:GGDEF domain-containing protein n=1 Tax=Ningiella sp. W23 TaxID=3023715 RepID=UPI003756F28A
MSHKEIASTQNTSRGESSFFSLTNILFGIHFGLLGGVINLYSNVNFFGDFNFYFGQIFVLLCLLLRGINSAIIAAVVSALVLALSSQAPFMLIILLLEVLVLNKALKSARSLLSADAVFWFVVGAPLYFCFISVSSNMDTTANLMSTLIAAINGALCIVSTCVIQHILPRSLIRKEYQRKPASILAFTSNTFYLAVVILALILSLALVNQYAQYQTSLLEYRLAKMSSANETLLKKENNANDAQQHALKLNDSSEVHEHYLLINAQSSSLSGSSSIVDSQSAFSIVAALSSEQQVKTHPFYENIAFITLEGASYFYQSSDAIDNLTLVSLLDAQPEITKLAVFVAQALSFAFLLASVMCAFVNLLIKRVTLPITYLAETRFLGLQKLDENQTLIQSQESMKLKALVSDASTLKNSFERKLEEQVDEKTRELKQLNRELYSLAQKDGLTQLLNRTGFNRFALHSYHNCMRNRIPMSLVLIDIDHFKLINDRYGHPFGDHCISLLSDILTKLFKRETDIIGRFGGEEFILLLNGEHVNEHFERVKAVKKLLSDETLQHGSTEVTMTVSAGILSVSEDFSISFESMIKRADEQLYLSKRNGRNKISVIQL